jgi:ELWxxDGT repeat protein
MLKEINPSGASWPNGLTVIGSQAWFYADNGSQGNELYVSDGTPAGTLMVKDINAGSAGSAPQYFAAMGPWVYFSANGSASQGNELWRSDGTAGNTTLVKDIAAGATGSNPNNLTVVAGTLYFAANTAAAGNELWASDGTDAGTHLVKDINSGSASASPGGLTDIFGLLYFKAQDAADPLGALWRSDGTGLGTEKIYAPGWEIMTNAGYANVPVLMTDAEGLFVAKKPANGLEPWHATFNRPPSLSTIGQQVINAGNATAALAFSISDVETAVGSLLVSASSSDQALVPDANLTLVNLGSGNYTVQAQSLAAAGPVSITVAVSDGDITTRRVFGISVLAPGATATSTPTVTPSSSPTSGPSATVTPTGTESPTFTVSPTFSESPTESPSFTQSPTFTVSPTLTPSYSETATITVSPTLSDSPTGTPSASPTATPTATATATETATPTSTPTATPSVTVSPTVTSTASASPTVTQTATLTLTLTASHTQTATVSSTPTPSVTPSITVTFTVSSTSTPGSPLPTPYFTSVPPPGKDVVGPGLVVKGEPICISSAVGEVTEIRLYNMIGTLVAIITNDPCAQTNTLAPGLYYLRVSAGGKNTMVKVMLRP